ncbi:MAG: hypothetical protein ACI93R_000139 [Flavobacteriales bacterium]|jgi:hypothetical protein
MKIVSFALLELVVLSWLFKSLGGRALLMDRALFMDRALLMGRGLMRSSN